MGNANGREDGSISDAGDPAVRAPHASDSRPPVRAFSSDSMANSPPQSPRRSRSPILFGPQVLPLSLQSFFVVLFTSFYAFLHFVMRLCYSFLRVFITVELDLVS